ncbi:type II toxin-antitoxin system RelE/ParE family toxin [Rhizobium sp. VS19-DR104.2]|nr:type II toxin-antitoxin system RelE/ParE family toxin [Rhizobium sp. VS19-DR129.2]MBZ5831225.1 type II toxin-antitoxin system RelE/ParE family toxin [Rhizobium sp. VS19-DR104.2]
MKRRRLIWSGTARADLMGQYLYIAESNSPAANKFILDIERKAQSFARLGLTGVGRDHLRPGLRSFSYRQRVFYFVVSDIALRVVRVIHAHEDTAPEDFTESIP